MVNIGTAADTTTDAGKDLIALAPGLNSALCTKINSELGVTSVPQVAATLPLTVGAATMQEVSEFSYAQAFGVNITDSGTITANKPYLCVDADDTSATNYTYYHVLVER